MDTQDFSFPRIHDNNCSSSSSSYGNGIDSPPLWNHLSPAPPSPQIVENGCEDQEEEEEPMDLLWEGFNEDLITSTKTRGYAATSSSSRELVEFRCSTTTTTTTGLTVSKSNQGGALVHQTKSSRRNGYGMVVIVKVLKKLFFPNNNSHGKVRRRRRRIVL